MSDIIEEQIEKLIRTATEKGLDISTETEEYRRAIKEKPMYLRGGMNIHCIPYEATMSLAVCESRKKAALAGDGLTNRKCLECKEGGIMSEEMKEVLYCKPCGTEIKVGEKYFKKTGECKKCYQVRWSREKKAKMKLAPPEAAAPVKSESVKSVKSVKPVKPKPENGTEKLDKKIKGLYDELIRLEDQVGWKRHELAIYEEVRGMLE